MKTYKLTPLDTLFFRDGRPFNLGETGQLEVVGTFPPSPTTVVGALRAALARGHGWTGESSKDWDDALKEVLGNHHETLGQLSFHGPFLLCNGEILFPVPLHLLGKLVETEDGKSKTWLTTRLRPGASLETDIDQARLPEKVEDIDGAKELGGYLTGEGMQRVLAGGKPEDAHIVSKTQLWHTELRVGIKRDPKSRTTKEDSLYNIAHVRLQEGVSLGMQVSSLPEDWQPQNPALLGGESRMVWLTEIDKLTLPDKPKLPENGTIRYTVTLMTPARLEGDSWKTPDGKPADLPGKVISACVGKPVMIGGWNSLKKEPLPLQAYLPAGSTWFLEARPDERAEILKKHGGHIGVKTAWGYGQLLIGLWEDVHR